MKTYERHELSALDGDMTDEDFQLLVESIDRQGVLEPVMFWEGKILDGWHRYLACQELKIVNYRKMEYEGNDPSGYVYAKSMRKSKTPLERAGLIVGLQGWETKMGRPSKSLKGMDGKLGTSSQLTIQETTGKLGTGSQLTAPEKTGKLGNISQLTTQEMADMAGVSRHTIQDVKRINAGIPELEETIKAKKISIKDAGKISGLPVEEQKEALEKALQEKEEKKRKPKKAAKKESSVDSVTPEVYQELQDFCENLVATLKRCELELQAVESLRSNDQVKEIMKVHDQLVSMTAARDQVMNKNAELQRQINYINRKLKGQANGSPVKVIDRHESDPAFDHVEVEF